MIFLAVSHTFTADEQLCVLTILFDMYLFKEEHPLEMNHLVFLEASMIPLKTQCITLF